MADRLAIGDRNGGMRQADLPGGLETPLGARQFFLWRALPGAWLEEEHDVDGHSTTAPWRTRFPGGPAAGEHPWRIDEKPASYNDARRWSSHPLTCPAIPANGLCPIDCSARRLEDFT